jgi:hypothetical protein
VVAGTLFAAGLSLAGETRLFGVHVGVVGCALNVAIAVVGSLRGDGDEGPSRR